MSVNIPCDFNAAMSELLFRIVDIDVCLKQEGGKCMTKLVGRDVLYVVGFVVLLFFIFYMPLFRMG